MNTKYAANARTGLPLAASLPTLLLWLCVSTTVGDNVDEFSGYVLFPVLVVLSILVFMTAFPIALYKRTNLFWWIATIVNILPLILILHHLFFEEA